RPGRRGLRGLHEGPPARDRRDPRAVGLSVGGGGVDGSVEEWKNATVGAGKGRTGSSTLPFFHSSTLPYGRIFVTNAGAKAGAKARSPAWGDWRAGGLLGPAGAAARRRG